MSGPPAMRVVRHTLAIVLLPVTMAGVVPWWLALRAPEPPALPHTPGGWLVCLSAVPLLLAGAALFVASLRHFAVEGDGTLAPWDPPRRLVVTGPYARVRNPMISGVVLFLVGEGLALRSPAHLAWACAFAAVNALYMVLLEEPWLRARFGEEYRRYAQRVPRLIPRVRRPGGVGKPGP